ELATQAERLQATIAYFRIDEADARIDVAATQLRPTAARMGAPAPAPANAKLSNARRSRAAAAPGGGCARDMGGADSRHGRFIPGT
ncbi:methyl-accepting chemotaxis protein, partial [Methylobacterium sp. E-066]|nr:methyl-accepting chemotaxis protein [Methylobacterium sp. E-066]